MVADTVFHARDVPQEVFYIIVGILDTVALKRVASRAHGCHWEATRSAVEPIRISCQLLAQRHFRELQADSMHCSAECEKALDVKENSVDDKIWGRIFLLLRSLVPAMQASDDRLVFLVGLGVIVLLQAYKNELYLLPERLYEKVAKLQLPELFGDAS